MLRMSQALSSISYSTIAGHAFDADFEKMYTVVPRASMWKEPGGDVVVDGYEQSFPKVNAERGPRCEFRAIMTLKP